MTPVTKKLITLILAVSVIFPAYLYLTAGYADAQGYPQNRGGGYGSYYHQGAPSYPIQRSYPVSRPQPVHYPQPVPEPVYYPEPVQVPIYYPEPVQEPVYYQQPAYQYYPSYSQLSVSCSPNIPPGYAGNPITWTAYASGGSGQYTYSWSGTNDPQSLDLSAISVSYQIPGTQSMNVTVWSSDGQSASAYCGSVDTNPYPYYEGQPYP